MKNLISVIIPIYNTSKHLPRCLDSVLAQTYTNLQIILVDDGSTDNSGTICDDYATKDSRIKVIHQENQGVSAARNAGLKVATGEYIGFVDSDDFIEPDMYIHLLNLLIQSCSDIAICAVVGEATLIKTDHPVVLVPSDAFYKLYSQLYTHNKLFKKEIVKNLFFKTDIAICEDMVFCFQAFMQAKKIVYTPATKYHYIVYLNSASHNQIFSEKKLSVFKATDFIQTHASKQVWKKIKTKIAQTNAYAATGLLRLLATTYGANSIYIAELRARIKQNLWVHLISHHKLSNKIFAVACCINFNISAKLYRFITKYI